MDGGRLRRPHLLGIYFMSKMHTKTLQKIQKAYIKTYEKDVKIYKDIENSSGDTLASKMPPSVSPRGYAGGSPVVAPLRGNLCPRSNI